MKTTELITNLKTALEPGMDRILSEEILHSMKNLSVFFATTGFLVSIVLIALKKTGWIETYFIPDNFFSAIYLAFSFILFFEVIAMIYALPGSIARSIGKQYQVISLVLIRHVFEIVGKAGHVEDLFKESKILIELGAGIAGTLLLFFLIGVYRQVQTHKSIVKNQSDLHSFVFIKKGISILLLTIFVILGAMEFMEMIADAIRHNHTEHHFGHRYYEQLFTAMIFVDILLVLLSMSYGDTYHIVFRNTGLMVSTVLLRMGFSAGTITWTVLTISAVLVGVITSLIYRYYLYIDDAPLSLKKKRIQEEVL